MTLNLQADPAPVSGPLEDHQAAAAEGDGRVPVTVRLTEFHHAYLVQRAAMHGETPERHLETILRNFRAHFDDRRPDHMRGAAPSVGQPAMTRRAG